MTKKNKSLDPIKKNRLKEILSILYKFKITDGVSPEKFRLILEELGPTFIKIGQIMSMRPDILPSEYCTELTKLRKDVKPIEYDVIKQIIEKEIHGKISSEFSSIEKVPLASASIAQVHRATLLDNTEVIIKVQKPNIYDEMASDIALLKKAFSIIKVPIINNIIDIQGVLDEMWFCAKEELDFLIEASHLEEFAKNNSEAVYIKAPKIFAKLSTAKILVLEYIDGFIINDTASLLSLNYDLDEIALKLTDSYIVQIIEYGFFHADPHPDNLKIQDGKIVFLDFGMMGRLSVRDRKLLKDCMYAIITSDVKKVERCILTLGTATEKLDHSAFCNDLDLFLSKYSSLELGSMNLGTVLNDLFKLTNRYKIQIPKNITMLTRGVVVIEGLLGEISPSIHLLEVLKNRLSRSFVSDFMSKKSLENSIRNSLVAEQTMLELPKESLDFVKMAVRGEAKFNLEISDSDNKMGKLDHMLNKIILAVLAVAFIVASSLLYTNNAGNTSIEITILRLFTLISSVFLTLWIFVTMIKDTRARLKSKKNY
ncbi:MAG: AarF/UbiB family protein [Clostridia bacterium]